MRTVAVLPVKRFGAAKQRLDPALSTGARRMLVEAMVSDVLTALRRTRRLDAIAVVTGESSVEVLARRHGAQTIRDPDDAGHVPAALLGVRWATEGGAGRVLLVPGDCPAASPAELDELLAPTGAHPPGGPEVVIVPDRHGTGTNALLLHPPDVIAPSFGPGSRERHERAARAAGARLRVEQPASLILDVDTAEDLATLRSELARRTGEAAHTRGLLAQMGRLGATVA
jgi:2-phospho-L-lactate/phosphoenolpyruvate guanylyltransferase